MNSVYISSAQTLVVMGTLTQQPQYYLLPNGTLINEQSGDSAAHICHLKHLDRQESGSPSESCTLTFATVHSCSLLLTLTHFILIWVAEEWSFPGLNYEKMYALSLVHFFFTYSASDGSFCLMVFVEIFCTAVFLFFKGGFFTFTELESYKRQLLPQRKLHYCNFHFCLSFQLDWWNFSCAALTTVQALDV